MEALVDPLHYFRLNRRFIAQVTAIQKIHTYFNGKLKVEFCPETPQDVLVSREKVPARLRAMPAYRAQFGQVFGEANAVTVEHLARVLAAYERTLPAHNAPYDRYQRGINRH